jgi:hypothetical protein
MPKAQTRQVVDYAKVAQDAHIRLIQMEAHLSELVRERRMERSRIAEDERRIVPAAVEGNPSSVSVTQGEAWICERVAVSVANASNGTVYFFRDDPNALNRLAEVCPLDGFGTYADSFGNTLYLPERTTLIAKYVGSASNPIVYFTLQIVALRRHIHKLTNEEVHALDGPNSDWDASNDEAETPLEAEPHEDRHGDNNASDDSMGGDLLPPVPERSEQRPTPHFRLGQAIAHGVEEIVEFVEDVI